MKSKSLGFSLLEISIVLIISSILLGISFEAGKFFLLHNSIETTKIKMNTLQNAIDIYLIENGKLPCPSGLKNNNGNSLTCTDDATNGVFVKNNVARGGIPYKELNLTSDLSYDSWKTKFTYSVLITATNNSSSSRNFKKLENNYTGITIFNDNSSNDITSKAVYSIVSHGSNKLGGFNFENNSINSTTNISIEETMNTINNSSFLVNTYFTNVKTNAKTYDDFVKYKTRMQLMADNGIDEVSCYIDTSIVTTIINNYNNLNGTTVQIPSSITVDFINYNNFKKNYTTDNSGNSYSLKCYKYGRLGIYKDE